MRSHHGRSIPLLVSVCCGVGIWLIGGAQTSAAAQPEGSDGAGIHAFRLYEGDDGNSHVEEGFIPQGVDLPVATVSFKITAPHSPPVWHNDPHPQYVVTMTGTLKFSTRTGETFVLRPGDVLIAEDSTGTGHGWEMMGDAPWTRTYAILPRNYRLSFVAQSRDGKAEQ